MKNKFDYKDMLNRIKEHKLTKNTLGATPLTVEEMGVWNAAIDLCYNIVKKRRNKFENDDENHQKK